MIEVKEITTFFGEKLIHAGVNLNLSRGRIHVLMGPCGGGKSSLLKLISRSAGLPKPGITSGAVLIDGSEEFSEALCFSILQKIDMFTRSCLDLLIESIPDGDRYTRHEKEVLARQFIHNNGIPITDDLLNQNYAQLCQAKKTVLLCAIALQGDAPYIFIDEPTSRVNDQEAIEILEVIKKFPRLDKTVLVVLHNQKHARHVGDEIHLLAGGRIIESAAAADFFSTPSQEVTKSFLATGSCNVPSPDAPTSELSDVGRLMKQIFNTDSPRPTGFYWLIDNKLAGCMRPGLLCSEHDDLTRLQNIGIGTLINLEEEQHLLPQTLKDYGISPIHFPIGDMQAPPDIPALQKLLEQIHSLIQAGQKVAVHCKAGLGRTGTLLAAYIVFARNDIADPIEFIRKVNPRWVQSEEQENFIHHFKNQQSVTKPQRKPEIENVP